MKIEHKIPGCSVVYGLLLCLLLLWGAAFPAAVFARDPITVRVGVYENAPKIFTDREGNASGFWPEIMEYIASGEGWEIEYIHGTWTQGLDRLEKNEIDIMLDTGFTEPRAEIFAFQNETVLVSWSRLYAREGADIQTILDLEGKTVAALERSFNLDGPEGIRELISKFDINCSLIPLDNYTEVFEMVESGEADAGVTNKDFGNKYEGDFDIERTPIIFQPATLNFAFTKESSLTPYLIDRIDYQLKKLKADDDSIYYRSLEKWLTVKSGDKPVIPGWVIGILSGVGGMAFLLVGGVYLLRYQVRSRTKELTAEISERKKAEERINHMALILRAIRNVNQLITKEKDRDKLLKGSCDNLVDTRGYFSAWIALLDESGKLTANAESGLGKSILPMVESMTSGQLPTCAQRALGQPEAVVTEDPASACTGCPLSGNYDARSSVIIRLGYEKKVYGLLSVSVPFETATDAEELKLFREVSDDLAFALHNLEMEKMQKLAEQERERSEKLESISTLAGGIAHDFNNLLTGIMGNISLAMRHAEPKSAIMDRLMEAERASERARDLTQQLLTFSREGTPKNKTISIAVLIENTATFILRGSNVKPRFSLPDELWAIKADEGQINQVITNLVLNADQAMPEGGVIEISAENAVIKQVTSLTLEPGNYIDITMEDHGIGITKHRLGRIFDPYFTTKQKGSGLGLATAYSIVKNHGGCITVESTPNAGTTFHVYLPASKKSVRKKSALADQLPLSGKGSVLIMDDEEMIRDMLKKSLEIAGYEAESVTHGEEAIERYVNAMDKGKPFVAVIMDLTIPGGMGGKEAVARLLQIDPEAKVIVSSGYSNNPIVSDYRDYGFKACINKPYSVRQLEKTLFDVLYPENPSGESE